MTQARLPSSTAEMLFILFSMIGFFVVAASAIAALIGIIEWLLSPSAWQTVSVGMPWLLVGAALGFIAGCIYMEENA